MKNLGLTVLAFAITLNVFAQNKETRNLSSFDEVSVGEAIEVIIEKGGSEKAIVEVSGADLEDIITEVKGGRLDIRMARGNFRNVDVTVYLTYKSLRGIDVGSAASLKSKSVLKVNELDIEVGSAGKVNLELDVDALDISVSSAGKLELLGICNYSKINVSSAGKLYALDLKINKVDADVSSAGKAEITVVKELNADANSGGKLSYKGSPEKVITDSDSGGRVRKY